MDTINIFITPKGVLLSLFVKKNFNSKNTYLKIYPLSKCLRVWYSVINYSTMLYNRSLGLTYVV